MKRFLMLLIIAITCVSLFASFAEARRFGGGSSFGKQRAVPMQRQQRPPAAAPVPAAPKASARVAAKKPVMKKIPPAVIK